MLSRIALLAAAVLSVLAALTASALPISAFDPALTSLTSGNFTSSVGTGMWMVEFYSPYCVHCKRFAPTWKDLVESDRHLEDSSDFHFARVNCIAQGDLCNKQNINAYPSIELYRDGNWVESCTVDRDFASLDAYVQARAADNRKIIALATGTQ
ncbi:thioredoxin-like protein [Testicularia cyperi]|uniref:Thioredoxin-like protein n=1 Tax=Testicularia cyperi TaxID=1882483 RepID=A0A317XT67_9BASI|nr:thioredoxin-like protein [Testicularia cyperi]